MGGEHRMSRRVLGVLGVMVVLGTLVTASQASAPPVGPLPKGPVTTIEVRAGLLFALVVPRPAVGLSWRGARPSDPTIARPLDEGELNGNIVFVYRAGHAGSTTVVYALTKDEQPTALASRFFKIVVFAVTPADKRTRCSNDARDAARFIIPPSPFKARLISVRRWKLPPFEPAGRGPLYKRLYLVTFFALKGNAVLPGGHRYSQFAYVTRQSTTAPWCFVKGGSGP